MVNQDARSQSVKFPVAELDGSLVWATDAALDDPRPTGMVCVGCGAPVVLRAGSRNRPHFAHKAGSDCGAGETVLHRTACRVLGESILGAARRRRTFFLEVDFPCCEAVKVGNLALRSDCTIDFDQVLQDGVRPDLLVRSADGTPRTVIEVIVTHAPEDGALAVYEQLGLPVVSVWPTWENLHRLRTGFMAQERRSPTNESGYFDVANYPCPMPRHPTEPIPDRCHTCSGPVLHLSVEVAKSICYRCAMPVSILDLVEHHRRGLRSVAASCEELTGTRAVAERFGVDIRSAMSRQAGGVYLAHHCRNGHLQGDNFIYDNEGVLDPDGTVQHMVVCQSGHWQDIGGPRSWPEQTRASRVRPVVGLVGNPTDLFDSSDNDHDNPSFHLARVTPDNMRSLINRAVYGSRSY